MTTFTNYIVSVYEGETWKLLKLGQSEEVS